MEKFEKYLFEMRETVKQQPKNDKERGFQMAVVMITEYYKACKQKEFNKV